MLKVQLLHISLRMNKLLQQLLRSHVAWCLSASSVPSQTSHPLDIYDSAIQSFVESLVNFYLCFRSWSGYFFPRRPSWPLDEITLLPILTASHMFSFILMVVVQSLRRVWVFVSPRTAALQGSLSFIISQSLLKLKSTELVILSNHIVLCHPLLLLPSTFPSIRVFSNESALRISWPEYRSFSFSICPSNGYSELISFRID